MKFLQDAAPKAVKEVDSQQAFTGKLVAIDASMCLYQFMIMIRLPPKPSMAVCVCVCVVMPYRLGQAVAGLRCGACRSGPSPRVRQSSDGTQVMCVGHVPRMCSCARLRDVLRWGVVRLDSLHS